jgi:hypothetical protein
MKIGTWVNMDDQAAVRVVVGPYSVEFHCGSTEIEMYDDALTVFIETGEQVLPHLRTSAGQRWAMPHPPDVTGDAAAYPATGTWVICKAEEPVTYLLFDDAAELEWGDLTWTITSGALARLVERARQAQTLLAQHPDVSALCSDLEVPDIEAIQTGQGG